MDNLTVITQDTLNIVLANALCCSSGLAIKVAKMYSIGNKCADSEFRKLKLLIDKIELLRSFKFDDEINDIQYINCIDITQLNKLTHDVMYQCDICDCQLT